MSHDSYIFCNLSTGSREALTGSASGFCSISEDGHRLTLPSIRLLVPQIELGIPGYKMSDFTTTCWLLPLFPGFPSSRTGWFMV